MAETKANGVGWAAREFIDRARSIAKLEVELALLEVKRKLVRIAVGIGLGAGAAVVVVFALGFLAAGGAAALALTLPVWASLLIVGGALLVTAAVLAALALASLRQGTPPVPQEAIEEARRTTETLRADGQ
jgi:Putative Actinobacterial Holin-X, holin superfamily III